MFFHCHPFVIPLSNWTIYQFRDESSHVTPHVLHISLAVQDVSVISVMSLPTVTPHVYTLAVQDIWRVISVVLLFCGMLFRP